MSKIKIYVMLLIVILISTVLTDNNESKKKEEKTEKNDTNTKLPKQDFIPEDQLLTILEKYELINRENITLAEYKKIVKEIFTTSKDQSFMFKPNEEKLLQSLVDKFCLNVPDTFPLADIGKYLTKERIYQILGELLNIDIKALVEEHEKTKKEKNETKVEKPKIKQDEGNDTDTAEGEFGNDL